MKEIFLIVLGAVLAVIGGVIGQLVDSWLRRKNRRSELVAERELDACVWIFPLFKDIDACISKTPPDFNMAKKILFDHEKDFWERHLLLPEEISNSWIACREYVSRNDGNNASVHIHRGYDKIYDLLDIQPFKEPPFTG